jgi:hypothetical protein
MNSSKRATQCNSMVSEKNCVCSQNVHSSTSMTEIIKSRKMRRTGHVTRMEGIMLLGKPEKGMTGDTGGWWVMLQWILSCKMPGLETDSWGSA